MARHIVLFVVSCCALLVVVAGSWWLYSRANLLEAAPSMGRSSVPQSPSAEGIAPVHLSAAARKNLGLVSRPLQLTTYWRSVEFPGVIIDRPGVTDRGVVAPVAGVVIQIHAAPGDAIEPGAPLFTLRLASESIHKSQLELFEATTDGEIAQRQLNRLSKLVETGAVPRARAIEIENEIERLAATARAYRQDLQSRGLSPEHIDAAARGEFLTELIVRAPKVIPVATDSGYAVGSEPTTREIPFAFEIESLGAELGQQVLAGQVLCRLADHRALLIEGRGFLDDVPLVQAATKNNWEVAVEFDLPDEGDWPAPPGKLPIRHVANTVDPQTRTFAFYLALENQWQAYDRDGVVRLLWRFRPGSRLRLSVPVERFERVLVVPQEGVVREGPEAFVFQQNGDFFDRRSVRILHEDRLYAVLANDGSVSPGFYIAQSGAASLNRVMKAQSASGVPANVHVHADGTTHEAH